MSNPDTKTDEDLLVRNQFDLRFAVLLDRAAKLGISAPSTEETLFSLHDATSLGAAMAQSSIRSEGGLKARALELLRLQLQQLLREEANSRDQ